MPTADTTAPWCDVCLLLFGKQVVDRLDHFFNNQTTIANNWHVWLAYFALFCWVDVDVNDFRVRRECVYATSNAIVET